MIENEHSVGHKKDKRRILMEWFTINQTLTGCVVSLSSHRDQQHIFPPSVLRVLTGYHLARFSIDVALQLNVRPYLRRICREIRKKRSIIKFFCPCSPPEEVYLEMLQVVEIVV